MINNFTDIETLPDQRKGAKESIEVSAPGQYKKPESIAKWLEENDDSARDEIWRRTALDGSKGEICVICSAIGGGAVQSFSQEKLTERQMLTEYWEWLGDMVKSNQWLFVAHTAKFDVPFLWHRSVINQVKPLYFNPHGRHGQHHYCTMEQWAGFNNKISLDNLAKALGVAGKTEGMDGSMVYDEWLKNPQNVIDYCKQDVEVLRNVYNRMEFAG